MIDMEWVFERVQGSPKTWTMSRFFERYTLHDGLLEGVRWNGGDRAVVAASVDSHWNRSLPADRGLLFFVFRPMYLPRAHRGARGRRIIGDARSASMSYSEREALLEDRSPLSRTIIEGVTSLELDILHGEEVDRGA
jgi:hypothetical protein